MLAVLAWSPVGTFRAQLARAMRSTCSSVALLGAIALAGGCTTGDPVPLEDADGAADSEPESAVEASTESSAADAGSPEASPDGSVVDVEADTTETSAAFDAEPEADADAGVTEAETPISTTCGDGVRDLTGLEECDFATTSLRAICQSCRSVDLLALPAPSTVDAGVPLGKRSLGFGRHTVAADPAGGFAVVFAEDKPWRLLLTKFDSKGMASDVSTSFAADASPLLAANPVVALADSGWLTAWTDSAIDGDGPGIAARLVSGSSLGTTFRVNTTISFTQRDPDVLRVGSRLVFAWTDASSAARGSDVKARVFSASTLAPLGGELELGGTLDDEADVSLATFGADWMATWRAGSPSGASETVVAKVDGKMFYAGPQAAGPEGAKPAIAELDATHAVVAYLVGTGTGTYEARVALLDTGSAGTVTGVTVATKAREVNLVRAGGKVWLTWRADAAVGDANGEEVWLKELALGTSGLDVSKAAVTLPRSGEHRVGDQRQASLAAWGGLGFVGVWEDFGGSLAKTAAHPDVVVELVGVPLVWLGGSDGGT